jgi:hypothetical protein
MSALEGVGVRVVCRPGHGSQINHGREGVIRGQCASGEAYVVEFGDRPPPRNWDFVHQEDMMVTADKNGHKIKTDIPEFLRRNGDPAQEARYREDFERHQSEISRVAGAARAGATNKETTEVHVVTPRKHPDTPGGRLAALAEKQFGGRYPAEIDQAGYDLIRDESEKRGVKRERSAEGGAAKAASRVKLVTFRNFVLGLRAESPTAWGKLTRKKVAPLLEKAKWPQREGEYRFTADEVPQVRALVAAKWPAGGGAAVKGKVAPAGGTKSSPAPADAPRAPAAGAAEVPARAKAKGGAKGARVPAGQPAASPAPAKVPAKPVRHVRRGR